MRYRVVLPLICIFLLQVQTKVWGQQAQPKFSVNHDRVSIGLGLGIDYGGIGTNLIAYPVNELGIFASAGYNLVNLGYNVGIKARALSYNKPTATPFIMAMYGYYAALKVDGRQSDLSTTFNGFTLGLGLDTRMALEGAGYWSFAILFPLRGTTVDDYTNRYSLTTKTKLLPIGFSVGYKIMIVRNHSLHTPPAKPQ